MKAQVTVSVNGQSVEQFCSKEKSKESSGQEKGRREEKETLVSN